MHPKIYGFNKSSEAGPDNFAPSIFLGGCNFRCPYCMNWKLVEEFQNLKEIPLDEVRQFLMENRCEWINVSGGELTCNNANALISLFSVLGNWDAEIWEPPRCRIAISTNGSNPCTLMEILPYVNYVTLDVKTGWAKYNSILPIEHRGKASKIYDVMHSLFLLRNHKRSNKNFGYEVRTTLYKPLVGKEEIEEIGSLLMAGEKWVLQPFRQTKRMLSNEADVVESYTEKEMKEFLSIARECSASVSVRHV